MIDGREIPTTLTPRERAELDWEKESAKIQFNYAEKTKQLERDLERTRIASKKDIDIIKADSAHALKEMDVQLKRLEVRWNIIYRLPVSIILLPVKLIMSLAIPISVITKHELPLAYWEFLRG